MRVLFVLAHPEPGSFDHALAADAREQKVFGDPLERIWKHCLLHFCVIPRVERPTFSIVVNSTPEQRRVWLAGVDELVRKLFPSGARSDR